MALSRSEIELVIKARSEAQAAFDNLNRDLTKVVQGAGAAGTSVTEVGTKAEKAGAGATAAGVAFGLLAERLARGLVGAVKETIDAANRLDSGLIGLSSVASAFSQDAGKAQAAAKSLAADGLMSVGEAATALKNLLAAGFGLDQAVELVNRFKDSAAFGRQAALGFGQAVSSATEGIKNGNSILVDNAGVTKNLSAILTEAGFAATDLSKAAGSAEIRMALFNGIIKETNPQLGDAARYLETAAGQQAVFSAQIEIAQQKIGKALQPALAGMLETLTPLVGMIGDAAGVLVPLGAAVSTIIVPLAAMRAAAALGIPTFSDLRASIGPLVETFTKVNQSAFGGFIPALNTVGEQAGITAANLGTLGAAASVAAAAFIGWNLGKAIDEITGLSKGVEFLAEKLNFYHIETETAKAKQDTINKAIGLGAEVSIEYAQAIKFIIEQDRIRIANLGTGLTAQKAAIQATLNLASAEVERAKAAELGAMATGTWTQAQKDALNAAEARLASMKAQAAAGLASIEMTERENLELHNQEALQKSLADAKRKYQEEVYKTGLSVDQLTAALKTDAEAAVEWMGDIGLSKETINKLKDTLKANNAELKTHAKDIAAADRITEQWTTTLRRHNYQMAEAATNDFWKEQREQMERLNAETMRSLNARVGANRNAAAIDRDTDFKRAEYAIEQAKRTGAHAAVITEMEIALSKKKLDAAIADATREFEVRTAMIDRTGEVGKGEYEALAREHKARIDQMTLDHQQGEETKREELRVTTTLWGRLGETTRGTVADIQTAVEGSFAQMILGAKGFKDGFSDIWGSIKAGAIKILDEILGYFASNFLKGVLNALAGSKLGNALGMSLGSVIGGGGGGSGIGGLLGQAGGAAGLGGLFAGGGGITGGAAMNSHIDKLMGAGGGGGGLAASLAGPGAGALVGGLVGLKTGSKTWGALSGAGTGAGIGAMFGGPVGAGIGAAVGGIAGLIGGLFGGNKKKKEEQAADQAATTEIQAYQQELLKVYGTLDNIKLAGQQVGVNLADAWGAKGRKGLEQFQMLMGQFVGQQKDLNEALSRYGFTWEQAGETVRAQKLSDVFDQIVKDQKRIEAAGYDHIVVLKQQAGAYLEVIESAIRTGTEVPAALLPIAIELQEQNLLLDENGQKIDLSKVKFKDMGSLGSKQLDDLAVKMKAMAVRTDDSTDSTKMLIAQIQQMAAAAREVEAARAAFDPFAAALGGAAGSARQIVGDLQGISNWIPPEWGEGGWDWPGEPPSGPPVEGGAADGVMANRPGLVLFGEGGETEIGGPARFFEQIFTKLGIGGGGQGSGTITVPVYLDGRKLAETVVPLIPGVVARHGR